MTVARLKQLIKYLPDNVEIYVKEVELPGYTRASSISVCSVICGMGGCEKVIHPLKEHKYETGVFIE